MDKTVASGIIPGGSLSQNEFDMRPEVFFIEFDGVLKVSNQFIIHRLGNEDYDKYKDILDIDIIRGCSMDKALVAAMSIRSRNPFKAFYKGEDTVGITDELYRRMFNAHPEMYKDSYTLAMYGILDNMRHQKFTEHIYIYHPFDDRRVISDIIDNLGYSDIMTFVYGTDLTEIVNSLPREITAFFLSDIYLTEFLDDYSHIDYTDISVARYPFNFISMTEEDEFGIPVLPEPVIDMDRFINNGRVVRYSFFEPYSFNNHNSPDDV